jgi:SAM-dependent methyltransferase
VPDQIVTGQAAAYRATSEALHRDATATGRPAARLRMLWQCGLADLIRDDFYHLLALPEGADGNLLEAGCGTGIETVNLRRRAPGLRIHGVDISSVALADAVAQPDRGDAVFHQAVLERLPFADAEFDYISSHEVIEHVEDPAVVLREFARVLRPGGVCAIATPNGASLWIEHLRQRIKRLFGRRGAPVGADHTRPPAFWRREFVRAGFVVERQMFDAAAIEFQMFVAPAGWMPVLTRALEPLRTVPGINLLLCDRVKFRLRKPGSAAGPTGPVGTCCPVCYRGLTEAVGAVVCGGGHRFSRNAAGLVDFTAIAPQLQAATRPVTGGLADVAAPVARASRLRRARRVALFGFSVVYAAFLLLLLPLGVILRQFRQPFATRC